MLIRLFLQKPKKSSNRTVSRREFFQQLWPVPAVHHSPGPDLDPGEVLTPFPSFRPPGAVREDEFVKRCAGCGLCADACPAGAIGPDSQGLAAMDVNQQPCLACVDVPCTRACLEGALGSLDGVWQIQIGSAAVNADTCWKVTGENDCGGMCLTACPLPNSALKLYPGQAPDISPLVCIGCGQCVSVCPSPGTIRVAIN